MSQEAFRAVADGATATIAATTTSANSGIALDDIPGNCIRIYNSSAAIAFFRTGKRGAVPVATAADIPVAPGATEVFYLNRADTRVAVILSAGSGNVYVTRGEGM